MDIIKLFINKIDKFDFNQILLLLVIFGIYKLVLIFKDILIQQNKKIDNIDNKIDHIIEDNVIIKKELKDCRKIGVEISKNQQFKSVLRNN
jgi:low affinity Fe/Cu permease